MKFHFKTAASTTRQKHLPASGTHKGEIHVWTHVIHYDDPFLRQAPYLLSQEEMARAARYHFEKDRRVYESSHVFIRKVLSHYTGLDAANIQLSPIVNQKPLMLNAPFPIHFNITHSGSKIMVAVGFDSDVGIDAERVIPDFDTDGFAEANYHPNELTELQSLKGEEETFFFYAVWTRKEAWLKLTGKGVNDKLRELDFSSKEAHPKVAPHGHKQVFMFTWKEGEDYIATLASDVDRNHTLFFSSQLLLTEAREDLNEAVEFGED